MSSRPSSLYFLSVRRTSSETHPGLPRRFSAQEMGSSSPVPLQPCCPPGDPSPLQCIEHNQRVPENFCSESYTPIIWIDSGLNIVRAGKDLINVEMKVILSLNVKFATIEIRVTLRNRCSGENHRILQEHSQQVCLWSTSTQDI